jgi:hypothetical protein
VVSLCCDSSRFQDLGTVDKLWLLQVFQFH